MGQGENNFYNDYNRGDDQDYIREKHTVVPDPNLSR